jgi:hypothetical protein
MSIGSALNVTSPIPTTGCYMDRSCAHSELPSQLVNIWLEKDQQGGDLLCGV